MQVKAIETLYDGYRFRSRLEARWAVFFNAAGIRYEYEPEGFVMDDGTCYLPDFYLPDVLPRWSSKPGLWVEVKGILSDADLSKVDKFSCSGSDEDPENPYLLPHPTILVGNILHAKQYGAGRGFPSGEGFGCNGPFWSFSYVDGDTEYDAFFARMGDGSVGLWGPDNDFDGSFYDETFERAFQEARTARFEHGETPQGRRNSK